MRLLAELLTESGRILNVYTATPHVQLKEEVDNIVDIKPDYVPMQKPTKLSKRKKPTTDKAENSLINSWWFYNNSDA